MINVGKPSDYITEYKLKYKSVKTCGVDRKSKDIGRRTMKNLFLEYTH